MQRLLSFFLFLLETSSNIETIYQINVKGKKAIFIFFMGNIIQIMQMLIGKYKSENIFFEIFLNVLICVSLMKFRVALTHGKS